MRNGEDVFKFQDVGLVNSFTLHSLILQDGSTYYVTVRGNDVSVQLKNNFVSTKFASNIMPI